MWALFFPFVVACSSLPVVLEHDVLNYNPLPLEAPSTLNLNLLRGGLLHLTAIYRRVFGLTIGIPTASWRMIDRNGLPGLPLQKVRGVGNGTNLSLPDLTPTSFSNRNQTCVLWDRSGDLLALLPSRQTTPEWMPLMRLAGRVEVEWGIGSLFRSVVQHIGSCSRGLSSKVSWTELNPVLRPGVGLSTRLAMELSPFCCSSGFGCGMPFHATNSNWTSPNIWIKWRFSCLFSMFKRVWFQRLKWGTNTMSRCGLRSIVKALTPRRKVERFFQLFDAVDGSELG